MDKFDFLIASWNLNYKIPKSSFSEEATGDGKGTFKRALNDKYVVFDYEASFSTGDRAAAHGIFTWDDKLKMYRYWWFDNYDNAYHCTGKYVTSANALVFTRDDIESETGEQLSCRYTFKFEDDNNIVFTWEEGDQGGNYDLVLTTTYTRKGSARKSTKRKVEDGKKDEPAKKSKPKPRRKPARGG